jgi:hypothetical protein
MERLPFDIIINHIIPYTYTIQPNVLLEDIKNYYKIKKIIMNNKYDINIIKHEISAVFYDKKSKLLSILYKHFQIKLKKYNIINNFYNFSSNKRFNLLFGLFTIEERNCFLEYLLRDNGIWIKK